ncbi:MAG TPA: FAD/NAD(P)-binding oxidoreductase, partial [Pyrinomonadaceae bacterium]
MPDEKTPRVPRRKFLSDSAKLITGAAAPLLLAPRSCEEQKECPPSAKGGGGGAGRPAGRAYDVIVIGSGFGATVAVTKLLERKKDLNILIVERGLWWLSPDRPKPAYFAGKEAERVQYYVRPDHNDGVRYLLSVLAVNGGLLPSKNEPLYNLNTFGDMNVLTASGVGGGSLIYLNVTIPPIKDKESGAYTILKD